jgi:hypothetical protein
MQHLLRVRRQVRLPLAVMNYSGTKKSGGTSFSAAISAKGHIYG